MACLASFVIADELIDDLLLLAAGPGQQLSILAKLRFGLSGAELARLAAVGDDSDHASLCLVSDPAGR